MGKAVFQEDELVSSRNNHWEKEKWGDCKPTATQMEGLTVGEMRTGVES